ncbi:MULTISPECIES: NAD(+) diphosphatase [unclassified Paludibacterium]|uniref:NAD(+) diphosphatase n=1 Tax=unclassified Paludibacterium TaxID=2618429 RepID=UPI001C0499C5|nr:NAD(+) diphosphatase [Paludibacterium sp. B53371]BEV71020.1 NAD(+) diphosphatase [Paludibacterium sp. THUN1379]
MSASNGEQQAENHPARWFIWHEGQVLLLQDRLPDSDLGLSLTGRRHIGTADGHDCYSAELVGPPPAGSRWTALRPLLAEADEPMRQALARARQLLTFEREHRFCGHCAGPLLQNSHDSGKRCPACNAHYYPRLAPAMMVAITRGRQILLARAPHFAEGVYSALAGFVEPGETLEQCVHRETFEEVGVRIHNLRYVASQSWPFPHSLMLAFVADYLDGDIVPQAGEIEDAQWFDVDQLPTLPFRASIAWSLLQHVIREIRQQQAQPD